MMSNITLYAAVLKLAQDNDQTIGEDNDLYITLAQLMALMMQHTTPHE